MSIFWFVLAGVFLGLAIAYGIACLVAHGAWRKS